MSVHRIMGTETEFGVYQPGNPWANAVALSTQAVAAGGQLSREGDPVGWDYTGEDPLNDLRGMRLSRAAADPSLLTDDPYHLAPSGGVEALERPSDSERALPTPTVAVLTNGARLYVDHAHPEYSAPETSSPREAVLWDRAGDEIARRIMAHIDASSEVPLVLVKNNTDGKGAAYGTHENYQVERSVDLDDLIRGLIPFMVTRPVTCGSGRVGLGQKSQAPGFQLSQRADFVENEVGLETTFNRPIINTRDEPHANPARFRRLHVIGGDASLFDISAYLKMGTTAIVLWAIEQGTSMHWDGLSIDDPVQETWNVSHDPTLSHKVPIAAGRALNAVDIQQIYLDLVLETLDETGQNPDEDTRDLLDTWQRVLDGLRTDMFSVASDVEWVAKYQLFDRQRERLNTDWADPRLAAMDLQWADLREERSLVNRLDRAGRVRRLFTPDDVIRAADTPPQSTRARVRGHAVASMPNVVRASWTSVVVDDPEHNRLVRISLPDASDTTTDISDLV